MGHPENQEQNRAVVKGGPPATGKPNDPITEISMKPFDKESDVQAT